MIQKIRPVLATVIAATCAASAAWALDVTVEAPDSVANDLRTGSLTAALLDGEEDAPRAIDVLSAAQADYARLIGVLYELGYFAPSINILVDGREAASIAPIAAPPAISTVVIRVVPGEVFTFGSVTITPQAPTSEPVDGLTPGATARVSTLRAGTTAQIDGWRQAGHAKAAVADQKITARHPEKQINAAVTLDPGPRLRFGKLLIKGETAVREKRIREIMGWPEGKQFDPDDIEQVENRMRRTGTFAAANLTEAAEPNPDGTLDVTATISDQLPRRYSVGAEYSTLDGFSVSALWLHRNIFGGAERLQIDGEVTGVGGDTGGVDFRLTGLLSRPATIRTDLEAFLLAEIEQRDDPNLFSRTVRLELGGTYFASETREYSYGVGLRRSLTRDDLGERDYTIFTIPLSATFDRRDDPLNATSGYYAQIGLTPFLNIDGTDNGLVTTLDLRTYRQLGSRVTLAFRGVLGSLAGPDIAIAPADFLFFSGGSDSVRGQEYQSLGVTLSPGVTIGGRSYLGLSGEVRVKTGENLSVVGFYDAGYIGAESLFDGSGEWHTGIGAGIRYNTPIGPIRFDLAVPGSGPGDPSGVEIYIGIGQAF
ncbi:BamA/TamA family outer membrane protein [uncultured Tateyamaria sp.]|uniref:autotransporter assembly complex protein TamA n=1 Tax=uncultured Tateyamaria sp. TaxID=455651 RepID=UPI0026321A66|nr:BamA/TamA family outer membrane protein [uncultured Tateyamaria sp.]